MGHLPATSDQNRAAGLLCFEPTVHTAVGNWSSKLSILLSVLKANYLKLRRWDNFLQKQKHTHEILTNQFQIQRGNKTFARDVVTRMGGQQAENKTCDFHHTTGTMKTEFSHQSNHVEP